jgi:hypothetical protein
MSGTVIALVNSMRTSSAESRAVQLKTFKVCRCVMSCAHTTRWVMLETTLLGQSRLLICKVQTDSDMYETTGG